MKKQIKSLLILCLTCLPTSSFSNELTISGTVRDAATGKPVPYIKVECINGADTFSAESGLDGRYNIFMQPSTNVQQSTTDYVPADFHLQQNYPNPFNPATTIQFSVPRNVNVQLTIYNILGQKVKTLVDKVCLTGSYSVLWDGTDQVGSGVSAGLYFYRLQAEDFVNVKKMILLDGAVGSWQGTKPSAALSQNGTGKLPKSANDFVTIRASSARIQPYEQSKVTLTEPETFFDIDVTLLDVSGFDKDRVVVSKPDPNSDVYTCGLPKAVVDTLSGTEKVKITNKRTFEEVVVDVNSHGGFRTTNLPGEIGDTLSFRVFSKDGTGDEQQLGETLDKTVYSMMVPQVCESSPANGDKDIIVDASINIRFTIPMDKSTITQQSFLLSSVQGDVSGNISFDDELSASFTPDLPLAYATIYTITLTTDIASLWGIPLGENYISSFTTSIGEPLIPDFQVNDDLGSIFHLYPSIATEKEGNFVIAWADGRNGNESIDVYAQKFSIDGKTIDNNFQVNNDSSSLLSIPHIAINKDGKILITWQHILDWSFNYNFFAQLYSNNGTAIGDNFKINDEIGDWSITAPSVSFCLNGDFIIAWAKVQEDNSHIYAQRFSSDGSAIGEKIYISEIREDELQLHPSIAIDKSNNFVVTWTGGIAPCDCPGWISVIFARRFSNDGNALGDVFQVSEQNTSVSNSSICFLDNGEFIITWMENKETGMTNYLKCTKIYAKRYSNDGTAIGNNLLVNDGDQKYCSFPSIAADGYGNFIITWVTAENSDSWWGAGEEIYGQRFLRDGTKLGNNFRITHGNFSNVSIPKVQIWNNRIYNVWADNRNNETGFDIWANVLDWDATLKISNKSTK